MAFSDKLKIFWYNPIKTATKSSHFVQKFFGFKSLNHEYLKPEQKNFFVISNFRNPYARYVSVYFASYPDKSPNIETFRRYVKKKIYEETHMPFSTIPISYDLCKIFESAKRFPDKLIKLENFYDDIMSLDFVKENICDELEKILKENIEYNNFHHDGKMRPIWKEFYDEETANLVYNHLYDNFVLGNYEKDSWKNGTS